MPKLKDMIPGGKGDKETIVKLAHKHGVSVDHIEKQYKMGIKVEREHTKIPEEAREITLDHLTENPNYYTKLKGAGLADELKESKVGDMYIEIGESIETIEAEYKKLNEIGRLNPSPELNLNLYKLKNVIESLKKIFGDSYEFDSSSKKPIQFYKMDVRDLIEYLDSIPAFSKYRDPNAEYDDVYFEDIPIPLLVKHGLNVTKLKKIINNTGDYEGSIVFDSKKYTASIVGGDD